MILPDILVIGSLHSTYHPPPLSPWSISFNDTGLFSKPKPAPEPPQGLLLKSKATEDLLMLAFVNALCIVLMVCALYLKP